MESKQCTKCKEVKPLSDYHKRKASKDGLQFICKTCKSLKRKYNWKAYREANKETIKARNKAYREANKETIKAKRQAYYEANIETIKAKRQAYRQANKEALRTYGKAYYEANKDTLKARKANGE